NAQSMTASKAITPLPNAYRASAEMKNIGQIHAVFRTIDGIGSQVGALRPSTWKPGEGTRGWRNILSG
ncbi:MAG: hypothetical protein OXF56_03370, partial [Rhodobacteraceae bacterium]|nr:hypothetical protein [Paracoccaceae bacterium]